MLDGKASSISRWKNLVTFKHFKQKGSGVLETHSIRHTESRQLRCKFFVVYFTMLSVCQIIYLRPLGCSVIDEMLGVGKELVMVL
jgi:hypothetical protein